MAKNKYLGMKITLHNGIVGKCIGELRNQEYIIEHGEGGQIDYFRVKDIKSYEPF